MLGIANLPAGVADAADAGFEDRSAGVRQAAVDAIARAVEIGDARVVLVVDKIWSTLAV